MFHVQSLRDLADEHDVHPITARRWNARGLIVWDGDQIDVTATDDRLRDLALGRYRREPAAHPTEGADAAIERRKQLAICRKHELDVSDREARLVADDEARVFAFTLANQMLDRISELPERHAHEIAAELGATPGEVRAALGRVVDPMLVELAADLEGQHQK